MTSKRQNEEKKEKKKTNKDEENKTNNNDVNVFVFARVRSIFTLYSLKMKHADASNQPIDNCGYSKRATENDFHPFPTAK